jgi:hypothetical protein
VGNTVCRVALLAVLASGLCGCATKVLWESDGFSGFNEPARTTNVQVFKCDSDWMVRYDEANDNSDRIRRRAYFARANADAVGQGQRPRFIRGNVANRCVELCAVVSEDARSFTLYQGETKIGTFALPVYAAPSGRIKQVLLTPLTVVADATIIGGFIGLHAWSHGARFSFE